MVILRSGRGTDPVAMAIRAHSNHSAGSADVCHLCRTGRFADSPKNEEVKLLGDFSGVLLADVTTNNLRLLWMSPGGPCGLTVSSLKP